jgi:hypothetical protein
VDVFSTGLVVAGAFSTLAAGLAFSAGFDCSVGLVVTFFSLSLEFSLDFSSVFSFFSAGFASPFGAGLASSFGAGLASFAF